MFICVFDALYDKLTTNKFKLMNTVYKEFSLTMNIELFPFR